MEIKKIAFYFVDTDYLEYLQKIDNSVAYTKKLHDIKIDKNTVLKSFI